MSTIGRRPPHQSGTQPEGVQAPQQPERAAADTTNHGQPSSARPGVQRGFDLKPWGPKRFQAGLAPRAPGSMHPPFHPPGVNATPLPTSQRPQPDVLGQPDWPAIRAALFPGGPQAPAPGVQAPQWPTPHEAAQLPASLAPSFDAAPMRPSQGAHAMTVRPPVAGKPLRQQRQQRQQRAASVPPAKLPSKMARLYKKLNLKITPDTLPAYTNQDLMGTPSTLGSGACNTVYAVKLKKPDGGTLDGVFKPLSNDEYGWVAAATGIPMHDPQIAMRNLATQSYAKLVGMDVVTDTRVAVLAAGPDAQVEGPKLGLVMARAPGREAGETDLALLDRADVRAEVTNLQLLDHLTGQGDRHRNNYFIDVQNGRAKVTGIDNDQCFGHRLKDPEGIHRGDNRTNYGFHGTKLPPVVDYNMVIKITSLTPDDLRRSLGDKLTPAEVEATVARHARVKEHIIELEQQGRIIDPGEWNQGWVTQLLDETNSYVGRERQRAIAIEKQARPASQQRAKQWSNFGW